jgi:hypothetical protein
MKLLERHPDSYAAANRPARINASLWLAVGLCLPILYGLALVVAVVVDAWRAGG